MPHPPHPLPAGLGDAFSCARARALGVTPGRLRGPDIERPFHGARLRPASPDADLDAAPSAVDRRAQQRVRRRAHAAREVLSPGAFFVGMTAAALWGAPLPDDFDPDAPLDVAVLHPARAPRGRGFHAHAVRPHLASVTILDGLRLASPASTWALLAGTVPHPGLVTIGDFFVRVPRDARGRPRPDLRLTTPDKLALAAREPGRRHRARLDAALADIRVGSFSRMETEYRLAAAAAGLPEMELDVEIRDAGGRLLGIADGVHRRFGVIVEVEGDHHRTDRRQWNRDIERLAAFAAEGWEVIRLTSSRIRSGAACGVVAAALRRHGWAG